ncbi:hypothetical protein BD289DRAFT_248474 [Coniella lustricola]|uniref:Putative transcription factor kapC n=1 Tax=Coniella lustricola TaxID=2025994 RepID=A0A2T3A8Z8_9PEZI|nr:hypothetical protein BD289DRAFT_248474 [Coniella lustricola]
MNPTNMYLGVSSPSRPYHYAYTDHEPYLDGGHSESYSSATSPYDANYSGDYAGTSAFPSPDSRDADDGGDSPQDTSATSEAQSKSAPKRKRENRYKNAPPAVLSRRRAQNRASQRAYRERKDQRIKDLEQMLNDARARNDVLSQAYLSLQAEYVKAKSASSPPAPDMHHDQPRLAHSYTPSPHQPFSNVLCSSSMPADMTTRFVDPIGVADMNATDDLEALFYSNPDLRSYTI